MVKVSELKDEDVAKLQHEAGLNINEVDDYDQISDEEDADIAIVRSRTNFGATDDEEGDEEGAILYGNNNGEEGIYERLSALRDIVPYRTRRKLSQAFNTFLSGSWSLAYFGGRLFWSMATTAFLFGVPALYSQMVDDMYSQMEQQARMQGASSGGGGLPTGSIPPPTMIK